MATRSTSATTSTTPAPLASSPVVTAPPLPAQLLIAQAVCQLGTADWDAVSNQLDNAEAWPEEAGKMSVEGYRNAFNDLMRDRGLDPSACSTPK
ncbi:hypothetical protein JCM10212_002272, partial [Sporobolomyces blumeae]